MKGPTPRRLRHYAAQCLGLRSYLEHPGDGRVRPQIPAAVLLGALLIGRLLREEAFLAVEALVRSSARRALGVARAFGDDALRYFTARLSAPATRLALAEALRRAKRNKAFDGSRFIGLAVDGTTVGRCRKPACPRCRPGRNPQGQIPCYRHHLVVASVVGTGLTLPLDAEPYGPGDSE